MAHLVFGFGSFGRSCLEEEIETMEGLYDLTVLEADEDDDLRYFADKVVIT